MWIAHQARKHGIPDRDISHAVRNAIRQLDGADLTMLIGPATDGTLLEVGVLALETDDAVVIHAMHVRDKYLPRRPNR